MNMRAAVPVLLLLANLAHASPLTDAVALAAADAKAIGLAAQRHRYLVMIGKTAKERESEWRILSGHLNTLSRQPVIQPPVVVLQSGQPKGPADAWTLARLLRVNLDDYGYSPSSWDQLGFQSPIYSTVLTETVLVTTDQSGRWFRFAGDKQWTREAAWTGPRQRQTLGTAPWLVEDAASLASLTQLVQLTQARVPMLSADNFVWQTAIQADRRVGYYGMLGVKNRGDFFKLVGLDVKSSTAFSPEALAAVYNSGVAQQPRRIARYVTLGGSAWATFDNQQAVDQANPLRFLNGGFTHKAEEWFAHGSNGIWKNLLCDANGKLQDSAPDFIGYDHFATSNDGRIHVGLSCSRCHINGGLQDVRDSVRNLYTLPQVLVSPSLRALTDARQHYFQEITGKIKRDRAIHEEAIQQATGLKHEEYAKALSNYFAAYDRPVTVAQAAEELGVTEQEFMLRLDAARKTPQGLDPVLSMFTVDPIRREPVPRWQWLEAYNLAQLAMRGYQQWPNR